jgi:hypothetical protein
MRKLAFLASVVGTVCLPLLSAASVQAQETANPVFVLKVGSADITLMKSAPPYVLVKASGVVATSGYANPRLVQVLYETPPADGIQDLYFLIDPPKPGGVVLQVITSVEAPLVNMGLAPSWMKGIRVWAQTNKLKKPCC